MNSSRPTLKYKAPYAYKHCKEREFDFCRNIRTHVVDCRGSELFSAAGNFICLTRRPEVVKMKYVLAHTRSGGVLGISPLLGTPPSSDCVNLHLFRHSARSDAETAISDQC